MKFGFIPTEGGRFYREALDEVVLGEELGFDSVWMEEHHGIKDHYWPTPLMVLAGFATRTSRVTLGTDVLILPFYHPTVVAEQAAMLDVMSGGRAILGVGLGYRAAEFALFERDMERRGARFVEQLQLLRALWTQDEVNFEGEFHTLVGQRIEPKPIQPGGIPIWLGGWGPLALQRAATYCDAWLPGPTADLNRLLNAKAAYLGHLDALGKPRSSVPQPLTRETVVAETEQKAWALAEKYLLVNYRDEYGGGWNHPFIGKEGTRVDAVDAIARDRMLIGTPDQVIAQIKRFQETVGVDHLIHRLFFPGMPHEHIMTELRLIAREVMPAFR